MCGIFTSKLMIDDPMEFLEKTGVKFLNTLFGLAVYSYFINRSTIDFIEGNKDHGTNEYY